MAGCVGVHAVGYAIMAYGIGHGWYPGPGQANSLSKFESKI